MTGRVSREGRVLSKKEKVEGETKTESASQGTFHWQSKNGMILYKTQRLNQ